MDREMPRLRPPEGVKGVLLALSGGPDSMLLLHLLLPLHRRGEIRLSAAHLNHRLRPEAEGEAAFVARHCRELGLPCAVEAADVAGEAARSGRGTEEAGRRLRYAFLHRQMAADGADCIALGQHMDDQAETLLLHLGRGSGLTGLCAMRTYRPPLWRPLLGLRKKEILALLAAEGIPYVLDASNDSPAYTRNRLRATMVELEAALPAFVENSARSVRILQDDEDFLAQATEEALAAIATQPPQEGIDVSEWRALHPAIARRALRLYARRQGLGQDLTSAHSQALEALCQGQSGRQIDLPQGYAARLDYDTLRIAPKASLSAPPAFSAPLRLGDNPSPHGTLRVEETKRPPRLGQSWPRRCECNPLPLADAILRSPRPGDHMQPLGMTGHKKLSDIWTDKKIPIPQRTLVVATPSPGEAPSEILLIPGVCLSAPLDASNCATIWTLDWTPH